MDYLTNPVAVLRDLGRVLAPGAPVVITFSNWCFPTKAVAVWYSLSDKGRLEFVGQYVQAAGNWEQIKLLDRSPKGWGGDPLYAVVARTSPH